MQNASPTIFCPNLKCRASNAEDQTFCNSCQTLLPKRYLWVVNFGEQAFQVGDVLLDRYVFRGPRVVLDTQPGLPVKTDFDIPEPLLPYLRLFPFRLHLPQFYVLLGIGEAELTPVLLLEDAPLSPNDLMNTVIADKENRLTAPLTPAHPLLQAWPQAKPLRQLNWLWQIAQLWLPLKAQGVVSSLLSPDLLRVEGRLIRLLELRFDPDDADFTLADLGNLWLSWQGATKGPIAKFFGQVSNQLVSGEIASAEALIAVLERAFFKLSQSQSLSVDLATATDVGMVRDHNEDSCYPISGTVTQNAGEQLVIVCDGVGGHAGGEVASGIAIQSIHDHIAKLDMTAIEPPMVIQEIEQAVCNANDLISQQNDDEQRLERQRMGTTLVMALVHNHQLYVSHIGDSRAYLITRLGCYQLSVDDDIASREVRLGYLPYREALRAPTSGSLVQALGMASSSILHPTVQRFLLDEDCIVLLCSDGLSDYDRVEGLWQEELLPLLYDKQDLATVTRRLIEAANRLNGHDNATVGLLHCQVTQASSGKTSLTTLNAPSPLPPTEPPTPAPAVSDLPPTELPNRSETGTSTLLSADDDPTPSQGTAPTQVSAKTKIVEPSTASSGKPLAWLWVAVFAVLVALLGGGVWAFLKLTSPQANGKSPSASPTVTPVPEGAPLWEKNSGPDESDETAAGSPIEKGDLLTITSGNGISVFPDPRKEGTSSFTVSKSQVIKLIETQKDPSGDVWAQIQIICSVSEIGDNPAGETTKEVGWVLVEELQPNTNVNQISSEEAVNSGCSESTGDGTGAATPTVVPSTSSTPREETEDSASSAEPGRPRDGSPSR
jgi:serine/threonine protein phosphatase PrpC